MFRRILPILWGCTFFCHAEENLECEVSVAALSLPAGADGMVHWRVGDAATQPLQLSARYFSKPIKMPVGVVGFYDSALPEKMEEPPQPLVALRIPVDTKLAFIVLWADERGDGWRGNLLSGEEWKEGCLRLFNSTKEALGILAEEKRIQVPGGKSVDFHAREWKEAFPVKIFRLKPEMRALFSSKWRVAADRRELCFIVQRGDSLSLRSLIFLGKRGEGSGERE